MECDSEVGQKRPNILRRFLNVIKQVTVEPVAFLLLTGSLLASTATQTLSIEKACRVNFNLSEAICDAVRNQDTDDNAENEMLIQEYIAKLSSLKSIVTSVVPCIILVFTGGWMDATGRRKVVMLFTVMGDILGQCNSIINVILFYQLRVEYLVFIDAFFSAFTGGWAIMFLAVFSYIADVTSEENRTFRVGLVSFAVFIGMPIGSTLSGILLKNFGYLAVYITALTMATLNAFYIVFFFTDPPRRKEHKEHDNRGFFYFLKIFFNPFHLIDSFKVVFRKTGDNRTLRLFILTVATCFIFGPVYGESSIMYMSTRYRFGWDELQYSTFQAYNMIVTMIGTLFCVVVVSKILGWHDSVIGIMSCTSKICASFIYAFATSGTIFSIGPLVDILNGNAFMAMRSIFSKSVEPHELARLNSIVGVFEVIMPVAYVPAYTQIYTATMATMPGFVFLLSAILTVTPLSVFLWLLIRHLRSSRRIRKGLESSSSTATVL